MKSSISSRRGLNSRTPLLMLPVRIETRFIVSGKTSALLIRIYPDQIHVNAHDPSLTAGEITDGQRFWTIVWNAGTSPANDSPLRAAWRSLVSLYRAPRAAWIVRSLTPTNLSAQATAPAPAFPSPPTRSTSWNQPPRATLLPDFWTVVLERGGNRIVQRGSPITGDLNVMLDPSGASAFPSGSVVDAGMQWMVDFDVAVKAGMALRISLDSTTRVQGFDRIVVYGLRSDGGDASSDLEALLDAHHYSDGLSFVPQGMPTKNTPDVDSLYKTVDTSGLTYATEIQSVPPPDPLTDAERLRVALGCDATSGTFARLLYGNAHGGSNGTDMLTALWPATLGYFLQQMMAPTFSDAQIDAGRTWTLQHAIPRNPLAAIRTGNTPYGILPTTALQFYPRNQLLGSASLQPELAAFLGRLMNAWVNSVRGAPHIGAGDPDQDLLHVLGMDASSTNFDGRDVLGQFFITNWQIFGGIPDPIRMLWWQIHMALSRAAIDTYGSPSWNPFVATASFDLNQYLLRYPTVCDEPLSEINLLNRDAIVGGTKMNYIDWIRTASVDDLQNEHYPSSSGAPPDAILYKLLRQSVLREYADLSMRGEFAAGRLTALDLQEPELINVDHANPTVTAWEVLARPSVDNPALTWAQYLVQLQPQPASPYERLAELRSSLQRLAQLPTAELDRLLSESLDACSHRLDVWITAIANSLLQASRTEIATGIHIGAYGWVENVRPAQPRQNVAGGERENVARLDATRAKNIGIAGPLPVPVVPQTDNGGYIHAPSYAQAATAAVLRAAYMSHKGTSTEPLLSIDLSSQRVERALWTLDGVREGQQLSALLGYRFEAELEALSLQVYMQPFRDRFPIVGNELTPTDPAAESVAASDVVDALAMRAAWDSGQLAPGTNWGPGLPPPGPDQDSVAALLKELDDIMDALSDLSISEAVFQVMRGNFERSGGLLDAVQKGTYAPEPQVIDTLRSGIDFTHRVMVLFAGVPTAAAGWSAVSQGPRALAEPSLDAWVSTLLPDPTRVRCSVSFTDAGGTTTTAVISLSQLDIGPLDFLTLSDTLKTPQRAELEQRIRYAAALTPGISAITISFDRTTPDAITFPEALTTARAVRALVSSARALQPSDLCEPRVNAANAGGVVTLAELQARLSALRTRFDTDRAALTAAIAGLPGATDPVRKALVACSGYGVLGAIPATSSGVDANLSVQAQAVSADFTKRATQLASMPNATAADALAQFATIFANTIVILPRLQAPNVAALQAAFSASSSLLTGADSHAVAAWIQQLTHVRPAIARLDAAYICAQLLAGIDAPKFTLGQLSAMANDRWLALPLNGTSPPSGRVALEAIASGTITAGNDYAGLLIDEWPERIPSPTQTAAISFHFEEPKSRAPQALLLAVCPDRRDLWDDEIVLATLEETLQLAKIRAVDLDSMLEVGQILPALYVPFNMQQATVQTRFRLLATEVAKFNANQST